MYHQMAGKLIVINQE